MKLKVMELVNRGARTETCVSLPAPHPEHLGKQGEALEEALCALILPPWEEKLARREGARLQLAFPGGTDPAEPGSPWQN